MAGGGATRAPARGVTLPAIGSDNFRFGFLFENKEMIEGQLESLVSYQREPRQGEDAHGLCRLESKVLLQ